MRFNRPTAAIVRSVAALAASITVITVAQAATDWSDWRPLPDTFQGKVQFRFRPAKSGGFEYVFRNGYDQQVTVKILLTGTDSTGNTIPTIKSLVLEKGEQKPPSDQTLAVKELLSIALRGIEFSGKPPAATAEGFYTPNDAALAELRKQIDKYKEGVKLSDQEANDANQNRADTNAEVSGGSVRPSDTEQARHDAASAADLQAKQHKHLEEMEARLKTATAANDAAKVEAQKRAEASVAARAANPKNPVTAIGAASGTTDPAVSTAVIATPNPASAPVELPAVPAVAGKVATLTGDQMKSLYKTAGDAAGKKDWPTVETSLRTLLDGCGDTIKPEDRADLEYRLGAAYDNDNKNAEAEIAYTEAIRLGMKDDALYNELATVQYSQSKFALAEKSERLAIEKKSSNMSYFFNLGLICMSAKKYKDAETAFRSALRLDPDNEQIKQHIKTAEDAQKAS